MSNNKISSKAFKKISTLVVSKQLATAQLNSYLEGLQDGLGLDGDWLLDMANQSFIKKTTTEEGK